MAEKDVQSLTYSRDGELLAISHYSGRIWIFDIDMVMQDVQWTTGMCQPFLNDRMFTADHGYVNAPGPEALLDDDFLNQDAAPDGGGKINCSSSSISSTSTSNMNHAGSRHGADLFLEFSAEEGLREKHTNAHGLNNSELQVAGREEVMNPIYFCVATSPQLS
ncbi:hypothetical protein BDQ12DRAFT_720188 [Crucibulum laeve]|uniref:Uncharacterized protein n=1 Tax=Crucibulum laeve TaxID=68775 RepID=A0A5C3MBT1_9AGAR|nr:hypothetical protein BDQ12DRAFT_720188 [Crucibulum laeve]